MTINVSWFPGPPPPLSLCCYVTTSKSVTRTPFDVIARIAKMLLRKVIFMCKERERGGKKEKVAVGWMSDKTFMITRVWRMDTEPLIQLVACS